MGQYALGRLHVVYAGDLFAGRRQKAQEDADNFCNR